MKFIVTRTSSASYSTKPCDEAVQEQFLIPQSQTKAMPHQMYKSFSGRWFSRGINHREDETTLYRDIPKLCWMVELDSFEALVAFIAKYGKVVLMPPDEWAPLNQLEIYDDYRE